MKSLLRALLPSTLVHDVSVVRNIEHGAAVPYIRMQLLRRLGVGDDRCDPLPQGRGTVMFVCHGNIIRSPMGAALLDKVLHADGRTGIRIVSSGLSAKAGREADARALRLAPKFGVSLAAHRAQPITRQLVDASDVIFVMDGSNLARTITRFPDARPKVHLLRRDTDGPLATELPDPYDGSEEDVRRCYEDLERRVTFAYRALVSTA